MQGKWLRFTAQNIFDIESAPSNGCYDWVEVSGGDNYTSGQ